jgi:hypothetical protein
VMVVPLPEEGENLPQFARKNKILRVQPVWCPECEQDLNNRA